MTPELQALLDADFGWVRSLDSVWSDEPTDAGPNEDFVDGLIAELADLTESPNPPGRVFLGQAGIGKTHFMGVLRRRAWDKGCWFVMLDVIGITDFWKSAALSFVTSLLQEMPGGQRQHEAVVGGIGAQIRYRRASQCRLRQPDNRTEENRRLARERFAQERHRQRIEPPGCVPRAGAVALARSRDCRHRLRLAAGL